MKLVELLALGMCMHSVHLKYMLIEITGDKTSEALTSNELCCERRLSCCPDKALETNSVNDTVDGDDTSYGQDYNKRKF